MTFDIFTSDAATIVTGVAAALCLTCGPAFRNRQAILSAQLCAGACFVAHYLCLGITVAAAANVLGLVQTAAAIFAARSTSMTRVGYALIGLMVLSGLYFWQGPISGLSVLAMTLIALGRMQTDVVRLRLLLLSGGVVWMAHDVIGAAWFALAADIGAFAVGLSALLSMYVRVRVEWRPPAHPTFAAAV
ncbi:MAG: YgjV family protein [Pseudomonadota bacterium]